MAEPKVISGLAITHDGCNYHAPAFESSDDPSSWFWFCNRCGQIGKVNPSPAARGEGSDRG